jgi:manganese/zinc/iron transport system permease protein
MEALVDFFSFTDPNVRYVTAGSIILAATASIVGCFSFLQKKSLSGDAVAHAVLPGVCLAFMIAGTKNPVFILFGAFITGWVSMLLIDYLPSKSKIKEDTAIGLILSVMFGIGIVLLTTIQQSGNAAQSGLDHFLFGKAASMMPEDVITFGIVAVLILSITLLYFKSFTVVIFDASFAQSIGYPVRFIRFLLTSLTVLAVVVGIQAVGVVLMAALLITPAAAARYWTDDLKRMIGLAASFGALSGLFGAFISYTAPSMPTGPWIVMVLSGIAFLSFFFAPGKGLVIRALEQRQIRKKIDSENILKVFYQLGEAQEDFGRLQSIPSLGERRFFRGTTLEKGLKTLTRMGDLKKSENRWQLTLQGKEKAQRLVKLHRLWEVYLTKYLRIAPDHVHEDAETIEHLLTPELEQQLEQLLEFPARDPHQSEIPYLHQKPASDASE